jgi:hypothetical protein
VITKIPVSVVLETITPELAKRYLEENKNNYRRLDQKTVRRYARDMAKGAWQDHHPQGIAFDWFGVLGDGQHRLAAIVLSGKSVVMWVHRGCDPRVFLEVDRCRRRTDADMIRNMGFREGVDTRRAAAVAHHILTGGVGDDPGENVHCYAKAYEDLIGTFVLELKKAVPSRAEVVAAFCKATSTYPETEVLDLARRYASCDFRGIEDPLRLLHVKLVSSQGDRSRSRVSRGNAYRLAVAAIRACLSGQPKKTLRPAEQDFPSLEQAARPQTTPSGPVAAKGA